MWEPGSNAECRSCVCLGFLPMQWQPSRHWRRVSLLLLLLLWLTFQRALLSLTPAWLWECGSSMFRHGRSRPLTATLDNWSVLSTALRFQKMTNTCTVVPLVAMSYRYHVIWVCYNSRYCRKMPLSLWGVRTEAIKSNMRYHRFGGEPSKFAFWRLDF